MPLRNDAFNEGRLIVVCCRIRRATQASEKSMATGRRGLKLHVGRHDIASGHVVFRAGTDKLPLEQRPALLEVSMLQWLKQHPEFGVRATLPITSYGHTVAIHVWFE